MSTANGNRLSSKDIAGKRKISPLSHEQLLEEDEDRFALKHIKRQHGDIVLGRACRNTIPVSFLSANLVNRFRMGGSSGSERGL